MFFYHFNASMSLSFVEIPELHPTPIAFVHTEKKDKKKTKAKAKILYMYPTMVHGGVTEIHLDEGEEFIKAVDDDNGKGREVQYISGQSGAGKSYLTMQYIKKYKKKYPDRQIYVFSHLDTCDTLDVIKDLRRIKIKSEDFLNRPISGVDFKDSLVIFDDCDCLSNKRVKDRVYQLMDEMLQTGRHHRISVIVTSHLMTAGKETRIPLAEAHVITIFPKASGFKALEYIGEAYIGMDRKEVRSLKQIEGRHVSIIRKHPRCQLTTKTCKMLGHA